MQVVAYIRVSTDDQNLGLDAQRAAIQRWADANDCEVTSWYEDKQSGKPDLTARKVLMQALGSLQDGGTLVVAKRDRIARNIITAALVERIVGRSGCTLVSADGSGMGDGPEAALFRMMLSAFAEYERLIIAARTKAALAQRKAQGYITGTAPYGFMADDTGKLIENAEEQATIKRAKALRRSKLSFRAIGAALAAEGHLSRASKPLSCIQVERILKGGEPTKRKRRATER